MSTQSKIQLIQNSKNRPTNKDGKPASLCDPDASTFSLQDLRETRTVSLKDLSDICQKYKASRDSLPATSNNFKELGILAANFPISDIQDIMTQQKDRLAFLRVYVGEVYVPEAEGEPAHVEHQLFIAPVDKNRKLIQDPDTLYSAECCGYPPHPRNFAGDPILGIAP